MRFQRRGVTFLNIDGTYVSQRRLLRLPHEWIDLTDVEQTNLYCETHSLQEIERRLAHHSRKGIVFIGSGNYHYVSYLLMKHIIEPFTLVLFDHHTDLGAGQEAMISCGSWVSYAITIPFLKKVMIVGATVQQYPHLSSNITIFPSSLRSPKLLLSHITTENVYISIDKDVLCRDDAVTNWDQGTMTLSFLLQCLKGLLAHKNVVGVDVCGEYPQASVDLFHPMSREANRKNEYANLCIAETCLRHAVHHPRLA
ncbi:arginase family enzyme [Anoxybacillus tepidamans]|jgi:arginase family enzyme|uniref:Arginase family enzyme n=1 Tax=Anoxybacteroides tepidamans TaxID=265948 RepID=A0A7W8MUX7_9BACL|nr:arginase family protein [Anoxybacillus tepidamans]MBB5324987.1 arginase family enzyme [Anoxybacillus tepidamans]